MTHPKMSDDAADHPIDPWKMMMETGHIDNDSVRVNENISMF